MTAAEMLLLLSGVIVIALTAIIIRRRSESVPAAEPAPTGDESLLRNAFDRAGLGVAFMNSEGHWVDVNRRFISILGYTRQELHNVPLRLLTHPEDRKREATLFAELRAGKRSAYTITKRLQRKGGEYRSFRVQMLRVAEVPHPIYQVSLDDGEHQATRLELISSALSELDDIAVVFCDSSGVISGWNRGAESLYGYVETEILGRPWTVLHRDANQATANRLLTAAATHGFARSVTARARKDLSTITVRSIIIPDLRLRDSAGFLEICRDDVASTSSSRRSSSETDLHQLQDDNSMLRQELEQNLVAVRELSAIHTQNQLLRSEIATHEEDEKQLREVIVSLRATNADLARKVRVLSGAIRKLISTRKTQREIVAHHDQSTVPPPTASDATWVGLRGPEINDTVRHVAEESKSGILRLRSSAGQKHLIFDGGHLVAVTSDSDDTLLGQLLLDAGIIDESQLHAALEAHRSSGSPLGSSLVKLGLATQHDIEEILRAKTKRELADAESWGDAESSFTNADAPTGTLVPIAVDVLAILAELHRENASELLDPSERDTTEEPTPEVEAPVEEDVDEEAEEAEVAEAEDAPLPFIGRANGRTRTYHALNCRNARTIPRKQRVYFSSPSEAESQQYKACNRCAPGE
jgi:PAS domain S-box-containing protein